MFILEGLNDEAKSFINDEIYFEDIHAVDGMTVLDTGWQLHQAELTLELGGYKLNKDYKIDVVEY